MKVEINYLTTTMIGRHSISREEHKEEEYFYYKEQANLAPTYHNPQSIIDYILTMQKPYYISTCSDCSR
jgi:hypothetical protein